MNTELKYLKSNFHTEQMLALLTNILNIPKYTWLFFAYLMVSSMFVQKTDDWFNMSFLNNV